MPVGQELITGLWRSLNDDTVSLFYHGDFDDYFTDKIIRLIAFERSNRIRGNVAFAIAESYQNVVRHKNTFLNDGTENVFGIRGRKDHLHIISSNLVSTLHKEDLQERIDKINEMSKDELRDAFMRILEKGELSDKGGAGMGLIEMARRSGNKLQCQFKEVSDNIYAFNMQVDFKRDRETESNDLLPIASSDFINQTILQKDLQFVYRGVFHDKVTEPFLEILNSCTKTTGSLKSRMMRIAYGLVQNISEYGLGNDQGQKIGLFVLQRTKTGFYICSGNYTREDTDHLIDIVANMNQSTEEELKSLQKAVLSEKSKKRESEERLGILDIRITSGLPLELKLIKDSIGTYCMFGVTLNVKST